MSARFATALLLGAFVLGVAAPAGAATQKTGYITVADGTQLRYTVDLPDGGGPFPVAMDYDGYCEGTGATSCNDTEMAGKLLAAGYAVFGVSVRGTGCSTGTFDFRSAEESADGAAAVEWAAAQPWSTGKVGMFGDSFPGITQPGVAALRPHGLAAIAPFQIVDDVYRDVGYPGGFMNLEFGAFWAGADQPAADAENPERALQQGDAQCSANYVGHQTRNPPYNIALAGLQHPYVDDFWRSKEVGAAARRIDVPVLGCASWQDDEVGSRASWTLFPRIAPSLLWFVGMNGYHSQCEVSNPTIDAQVVRFFDRFVAGKDNGFEATPRVQIWHEAHRDAAGDNVPSWVTTFERWPPHTKTTPLYLRSGGLLSGAAPSAPEAPDTYSSPAPSAGTEEGVVFGQNAALWRAPVPPGGTVAWTSPPLAADRETLGPASADLWISSTASDVDLQVTITEVRPDGQETYVARGWLRASQRKLDPAQSTPTRPFQTHLESDVEPLTPGVPALARVEVFPFDHVFRAGSRLRMIVDTPSQTGGWGFAPNPAAGVESVLHDPGHPSRLVLGDLPGGGAQAPLPACNTLLNQPCRADAFPAQ